MALSNIFNFSTPEMILVTDTSDVVVYFTDNSSSSPVPPTSGVFRVLSDDFLFEQGVTTVFIIAYAIVIVPAIFGNLFILAGIACHPVLRAQHSNIYVINLAICDLMVVVAECPFIIIQFLMRGDASSQFLSDAVCRVSFFINNFFGTCSILTMLAIGVERYCAVMHPLQAMGENTASRAKNIIFFFWSFTLLTHLGQLALFGEVKTMYYVNHVGESFDVTMCMSVRPEKQPIYSHVYSSTVFVLVYGSTFTTTLVLYIRILQYLKRRKYLRPDQMLDASRGALPTSQPDKKRRRKSVAPKTCTEAVQKTSRMLSCSILSYLVCYSLYFYINLYYIYYGLANWNGMALLLIANWFGALNSLINPIVYAIFVDQIREAFGAILTGRSWRSTRARAAGGGSGAGRRQTRKAGSTETKVKREASQLATITGGSSIAVKP